MNSLACTLLALVAVAHGLSIDKHPYHVSIEYNNKHVCSGALISADTLLTAASCVFNLNKLNVQVRAGSELLETGGVVAQVNEIKTHKRYYLLQTINRKDFDLAIIKLDKPLTLSESIRPIDLPSTHVPPTVGSSAVVTGWGLDDSGKLSKVAVQISRLDICKNAYADLDISITERMFCAAQTAGKPCNFEAGNPLVSNDLLLGLSAWEQKCGSSKYPGIYTDLASLKMRNWVKDNTGL